MIKQKPDIATMGDGGADSFLSRWSKRKRGAAVAPPAVDDGAEPVAESAAVGAASEPVQPVAMAEPAVAPETEPAAAPAVELPALESLDENSDYRGFLSPEVDEKLQRLALRKLFSTAGFNVRDGLDDYDDDFTVFEPLGDIVTADMRHQAEVEARREEARRLAAGEQPTAEAEAMPQQAETDAGHQSADDQRGEEESHDPALAAVDAEAARSGRLESSEANNVQTDSSLDPAADKRSELDQTGVNRG